MSGRDKKFGSQSKCVDFAWIARPLAVLGLCSLSAMPAAAVQESFDYADGVLDGQGAVGEWTGPWQPGPASLTGTPPAVAPFQVESSRLKIDFSDQGEYGYEDWDVQRSLTSPIATPSVYVSFEITPGEMGSRVATNDDGYAWLNVGLSDGPSNMGANGPMFSVYEYNSGGTPFVAIGSSLDGIYDGTTSTVGAWTPGETYRLVGRLDFNASGADEQWTVWLDPTDELSTPQVVTSKDLGYTSIGFTQMWYSIYNLDNTEDTYLDDLRIGSTWQSVVPEPSSLALLGLGGLFVSRRRRGN